VEEEALIFGRRALAMLELNAAIKGTDMDEIRSALAQAQTMAIQFHEI